MAWKPGYYETSETMCNTDLVILQRETRRINRMLHDEDADNFTGWKIGPGYVVFRDA